MPATSEIPFAVQRKSFLQSEIARLKIELAQSAHAISQHLEKFRDVRTVTMENRVYSKVGAMTADPTLHGLETAQRRLLAQWTEVLNEWGKLDV